MECYTPNKTTLAKDNGQKIYHWRQSLLFSCLTLFLLFSCQTEKSISIEWVTVPKGKLVKEFKTHLIETFQISNTPITNQQFQEFVDATNYITEAEKDNYGGMIYTDRWEIIPSANWRHPSGEKSSIKNKMNHPVVMVTYNDAKAYCKWSNTRLPTEYEWEYACLKGNTNQRGININYLNKNNIDTVDGFEQTSPVKQFEPNQLNIYTMLGNVWEICESDYDNSGKLKVIKGGSFLCNANFCIGYTPESRQSITLIDPYFHTGFRVIKNN